MANNIDPVSFRIQQRFDPTGTYEPLSPEQQQAFAANLASVTGTDAQEMTDRVADQVEADATPPTLPESYTNLGRFADAAPDATIGEGFKDECVTAVQERLLEDGYDVGAHGADGLWGPETRTAFDRYVANGKDPIELGQTDVAADAADADATR